LRPAGREIPKRVRADPVGANRVNLPAGAKPPRTGGPDSNLSPSVEKFKFEVRIIITLYDESRPSIDHNEVILTVEITFQQNYSWRENSFT
jgi:hypothetical protein